MKKIKAGDMVVGIKGAEIYGFTNVGSIFMVKRVDGDKIYSENGNFELESKYFEPIDLVLEERNGVKGYKHCCGGWVALTAIISGNASVFGNASVSGNAIVSDYAIVSGNAMVSGYVKVTTTPKTINLPDFYNTTIFCEEEKDNYVAIGCESHRLSEWEKNVKKIAFKHKADLKRAKDVLKIAEMLMNWRKK